MAGTLFVQAPQVLWRDAGSEILLAPRDRQDVDVLSPTAGAVWRLLGQPVSEEELVEALARAFSVPVDA
ncbi:MAG TPA: PqqD family protein, partial [Actinomycetota bacterium]